MDTDEIVETRHKRRRVIDKRLRIRTRNLSSEATLPPSPLFWSAMLFQGVEELEEPEEPWSAVLAGKGRLWDGGQG